MKNFKLKKLLALMTVTLITAVTILPIKASAAWKQSDSGNWSYTEGNTSVSGWKSIDGKWYFFDSNATMKTGWILDGSSWYYTTTSGEMKTGWINDGGKWYYTTSSGAMQTGWLSNNGAWYYLNTSGDMKTGLIEINNKTYYLSESGAMKTGNVTVNGVNYSFAASGEKINQIESKPATTTAPIPVTTDSTTSGGSGGSGGGSSPSVPNTDTSNPLYKSLYGTWKIGNHIPSNVETIFDSFIGEKVTIKSNSISLSLGTNNKTISNPTIKEGTMKSLDFSSTYKVDVSGDTVKYVRIIQTEKPDNYVTIFITNDGTVYTLVVGELFELKKQ